MGKVQGVNVVVGIPSFGMVSTYFLQSRISQQFPLVSSAVDKFVLNKPIAEARNEIVQYALDQGANYIYWLDDDVIPPPDAFLKMYMAQKDIVNGVYWSKSNPPMPLLFRNHLEGPYLDWHVGDFIEIDAAGNGLTLVKTDVYRKISETVGGPWYSTDYTSFKNATQSAANNTEDLYFYWKAKKAGFKVWADTSIQAYHYEKHSQVLYAMPFNARQAVPAWSVPEPGNKLIADLGAGPISPQFDDAAKVVSFDIREDVKPDVVCDLRKIPVPDETFDVVFSSHTLEHFAWTGLEKIMKEWSRILKVGGELRLVVPNMRYVAQRLLDDDIQAQDFWVIWGEQDYQKNFHASGFTPKILNALISSLGIYEDIKISEGDVNGPPNPLSWNLTLTATKVKHPKTENITPDYVEAPKDDNNNYWPMKMFQEYNVRELDKEKESDLLKWTKTEAKGQILPEGVLNLFWPKEYVDNMIKEAEESKAVENIEESKPKAKRARKPKIAEEIEEVARQG